MHQLIQTLKNALIAIERPILIQKKCDICDYDFKTKKVDKYTCPNCKREISSKLIKCIVCNYDFITGRIDKTRKNCYETNKNVTKKVCPGCGKMVNEKFVQCTYCGHGL